MVDTFREQLRDYRARVFQKAKDVGIVTEDIRREQRTEATVGKQITDLMNTTTPTPRRGRTVVDNPVTGTFDGINHEFLLSQPVAGTENLAIGVVSQATGTVNFPTRTTHPAPGSGSFWFDGDQTIRVGAGDLTSALDRVFAVYPRKE